MSELPDNTTYGTMPMVDCPHCGKEFQWDDYYDVKAGDERDCPKCERTIHVESADVAIEVILSTKPQP